MTEVKASKLDMFYQDHHSHKVMLEVLSMVFICDVCRMVLPLHVALSFDGQFHSLMNCSHGNKPIDSLQLQTSKKTAGISLRKNQSLFYCNTFLKQQKNINFSVCSREEWHYCQLSKFSLWISFWKNYIFKHQQLHKFKYWMYGCWKCCWDRDGYCVWRLIVNDRHTCRESAPGWACYE